MNLRAHPLAVLVILLAVPLAALASPTPADRARAENHRLQAKAFYEAGVYDEAAAEFLKAYELDPVPKLLGNIGISYAKLGQREKAVEYLNRFVEAEPSGPYADETRARIEQLKGELAAQPGAAPAPASPPPAPPPAPAPAAAPAPPCEDLAACAEQCIQQIASGCEKAGRLALAAPDKKDNAVAVSYFEAGCRAGAIDACYTGGDLLAVGRGVGRDAARAIELFLTACEHGQREACARLGWIYRRGDVGKPDPVKAAGLFQKSCDEDSALGCYGLATIIQVGDPLPKNIPRALELHERACARGEARACLAAGVIRQEGVGAPRDPLHAIALYDKACSAEVSEGCMRIAALDVNRKAAMLTRACKLRDEAGCAALAASGNLEQNLAPLRDGCIAGMGPICYLLGQRSQGTDQVNAGFYYDLGCTASHPASCGELAKLVEAGKGVRQDVTRARVLYRRACDLGVAESCYNLARLNEDSGEDRAAQDNRQRACQLGFAPACH